MSQESLTWRWSRPLLLRHARPCVSTCCRGRSSRDLMSSGTDTYALARKEVPSLSLGRVDPAPHTQHLLGPFEAIAQNSLLRSFSIVDSLANRQHSCRGSEELAIRFQATPNYFAALRATPSGGRPITPSYSELLQATPSYSELLRATPSHSERLLRATRTLRARIDFAGFPSYSELLRVRGAQEPRATPSCSQKLRALRASWSCKLCPKSI